jgi:hypothetical protein
MRSLKMAIAAIVLAGTMSVQAQARERGMNGLVIGAGSGALVGQAIGRDTEATLVGTAVGGMIGYVVGNEIDRGYGRVYVAPRPVVYGPPPPPPPSYAYRPYYDARDTYRHDYRPEELCRETVVVRGMYGQYREVTTTCRDRWRDDRYRHWRGHHHNRYGYGDRW